MTRGLLPVGLEGCERGIEESVNVTETERGKENESVNVRRLDTLIIMLAVLPHRDILLLLLLPNINIIRVRLHLDMLIHIIAMAMVIILMDIMYHLRIIPRLLVLTHHHHHQE